jgi:hypothetical protein
MSVLGAAVAIGSGDARGGENMGSLEGIKRAVEASLAFEDGEKRQTQRRDFDMRNTLLDDGTTIAGHDVAVLADQTNPIALIIVDGTTVGRIKVDRGRFIVSIGSDAAQAFTSKADAIGAIGRIVEQEIKRLEGA